MSLLGSLIILFLLFLVCFRVFVVRNIHRDTAVILSPMCLILSLLYVLSFRLNLTSMFIVTIALYVFIINIHSLLRFSEKLFYDKYSIFMKIGSAVGIVSIILCAIFVYVNRPVELSNKKLEITETKKIFQGNIRSGFDEPEAFAKRNAFFTEYKAKMIGGDSKNIVVLFTDKRGDSSAYKPYLQLLAQAGYTVCTCDFYTDDIKWPVKYQYGFIRDYLMRKLTDEEIAKEKDKINYNYQMECYAMEKILHNVYGYDCHYYLVADGMAKEAVKSFSLERKPFVNGVFFLDSINEYQAPGFGCIEMTNPQLAGSKKIKKDKDAFYTKYMVLKTSQEIIDAWSKS